MKPHEFVFWFYEKFKDGLLGLHLVESVIREHFDQVCLIDLIERYNCKSVLEIGTWEGQTGLLLWLHPNVKKFKAIDIHKGMKVPYAHPVHHTNKVKKEFMGHYLNNTNTSIDFIDTMKWNPLQWKKKEGHFDMIFIDGNHSLEHVRNDTLKALKLKPKIIVWHDVAHVDDKDNVPLFLREFTKTHSKYKIYTIENSELGYIVL